ncbi:hypothetical protein LINGRAHAP2_LOCUS30954, partial [Linum grandiflorum]
NEERRSPWPIVEKIELKRRTYHECSPLELCCVGTTYQAPGGEGN